MLLAAISLGAPARAPVCDFRLTLQSDGQKKYTNGSSVYTTNATFYESLGLKTRAEKFTRTPRELAQASSGGRARPTTDDPRAGVSPKIDGS